MAKRVHRRRHKHSGRFVKGGGRASNPPRRRRRRHHHNAAAAPTARRRRRPAMRKNSHHRRHHRRNPPRARGAISAAVSGVMHGFGVVTGGVLARKARGGLQGVVTTNANVSTGLPGLATTTAAAIAGTVANHMFTPARHRELGDYVVAGMWAEAITFGLALTPVAPYLSAFPPRNPLRIIDNSPTSRLSAYARAGGGRLSAYSRGGATFGAYTRTVGVPVSAGNGSAGY